VSGGGRAENFVAVLDSHGLIEGLIRRAARLAVVPLALAFYAARCSPFVLYDEARVGFLREC
jgi:hypothetical protein